ncbi:undecaprenyl-phosphate glucose phosphotransferase [Magnetofaba australis]|uniref:Putative undecaprenyl-phosphate galactosephosphotransferase n=1 Tax=Magnetofaba australis IT-1 TaxID=1434232 RepID=A0A1Y2K9F3_9PROT|nr:undecaprenyl-phosphate glucose phosphotransferase [Magnetofaba australis]OSM07116.1 putative undecaprenyl-phosphate galactosephosphotransferase [Magnetofaba australis IT-1]
MARHTPLLIELSQRSVAPILAAISLLYVHLSFGHELNAYQQLQIIAVGAMTYIAFAGVAVCQNVFDLIGNKGRQLFQSWGLVVGMVLLWRMVHPTPDDFPRYVLLTWLFITPAIIFLGHVTLHTALNHLYSGDTANRERVLVVGATYVGTRFANEIEQNPMLGKEFLGFFDDRDISRLQGLGEEQLKGKSGDVIDYVKKSKVDTVYISLPMTSQERIMNLIQAVQDSTASIYFLPDIFLFDLIQARFDTINGIPIVAVVETPFYGMNALKKRLFDIVAATSALILLSPVMLALTIAIKLDSPGPAIFRQRRYGMKGEEITVYKFRSMTVQEDGKELTQAKLNDPRITRIGAFIRRTSLDELPQFFNVLQGRMSVVGPRPHAVAHNEEYRKIIKGYMLRHKVRPGITGWAQVNGLRGEIKHLSDMERRTDYDLDYLRCWSLSFDFWIILRTIYVVIKGQDTAY